MNKQEWQKTNDKYRQEDLYKTEPETVEVGQVRNVFIDGYGEVHCTIEELKDDYFVVTVEEQSFDLDYVNLGIMANGEAEKKIRKE